MRYRCFWDTKIMLSIWLLLVVLFCFCLWASYFVNKKNLIHPSKAENWKFDKENFTDEVKIGDETIFTISKDRNVM